MEIPRHWRLKKQRYGLVGEVCPHCDHKIFPPRENAPCPNCGGGVVVALEAAVGADDQTKLEAAAYGLVIVQSKTE